MEKVNLIEEIWMIARRMERLKKIEQKYPQQKFRSIGKVFPHRLVVKFSKG
jgi:hypothetical protein